MSTTMKIKSTLHYLHLSNLEGVYVRLGGRDEAGGGQEDVVNGRPAKRDILCMYVCIYIYVLYYVYIFIVDVVFVCN